MMNNDGLMVAIIVGSSLAVFPLADKLALGNLSKAVHKMNS